MGRSSSHGLPRDPHHMNWLMELFNFLCHPNPVDAHHCLERVSFPNTVVFKYERPYVRRAPDSRRCLRA